MEISQLIGRGKLLQMELRIRQTPHWGSLSTECDPTWPRMQCCDEPLSGLVVMLGLPSALALQQPWAGSCLAAPAQLQLATWWPFLMLPCVRSSFILYHFPSLVHICFSSWLGLLDSSWLTFKTCDKSEFSFSLRSKSRCYCRSTGLVSLKIP